MPSSPSSLSLDRDLSLMITHCDADDSNDGNRHRMESRLLDAAIELAREGLYVFPLAPRTKIPRSGSAGFRDATADIAQIRDWWNTDPQANIGVRTTGLAIIDADLYHPGSEESWQRLLDLSRSDSLPVTWVSRTGRGGTHHWYSLTAPEDRFLKNGYTSSLPIDGQIVRLPHIDMKCCGGSYVVAPPSEVPEGFYVWLQRDTIAPAPHWIRGPKPRTSQPSGRSLTPRVRGSAKRVAAICERIAIAPTGQRNHTLNWGAFYMAEVVLAGALGRQQAHDALLEAAIEAGLGSTEAETTILSAFAAQRI
jgi:hypothetical protein